MQRLPEISSLLLKQTVIGSDQTDTATSTLRQIETRLVGQTGDPGPNRSANRVRVLPPASPPRIP